MKIPFREWVLFILIAVFCLILWFNLGYPQFTFIDLSVDKKEALRRAESYLVNPSGIDTTTYSRAVVFDVDDWADRYLQKTKGLSGENEFIRQHNYELFSWKVRFFKEFQKEEYVIKVSPISGAILDFEHFIEDIAPRVTPDKDMARQRAQEFLQRKLGINFRDYDFHEEKTKRYDRRVDYSFSWEKKGVYIPWRKDEGGAKLLIGATVSGDEIREFYKNSLDVPEKFQRYIQKQLVFGEYLFSFYFLVFTYLVIFSVFTVVRNKDSVISRFCKNWFISLGIFLVIINLAYLFNNIQSALISYPTSVSLASFFGIYLVKAVINLIFFSFAFIMPGVAGESLRQEVFPRKIHSSFAHYLRSTFYSRQVSQAVLFGYILFFIMLGLQAGMFHLGQKYLGVWKEWHRLAQFSSACIPFLSAFIVGISASLNEEVIFRLFGLSWAKKYLKDTALAVIFVSLVWGVGHSAYPIFPVWFRTIEVGSIGLLYGFIFTRYGLIPLIIAHYLFDVFWGTAAFILGHSSVYLFSGSLFVLALPLVFAIVAYAVNREEKEGKITHILSQIQRYNLGILATFISKKKSEGMDKEAITKELMAHNWDTSLIDLATKEVFGPDK